MFKRKDCSNGYHDLETETVVDNPLCPIELLKCKRCGKEYWLFNNKWLHAKTDMPTSIEEVDFLSNVGTNHSKQR